MSSPIINNEFIDKLVLNQYSSDLKNGELARMEKFVEDAA